MSKNGNDEKDKIEVEEIKESEVQKENSEKNVERKEIEKIKSNVDKLSEELNTAVSDLKQSIVDIRSAVSEIENPFNLLRAMSSEKDLKRLNNKRLPPGVKSLVLGKTEEKAEEEAEEKAEKKLPVPSSSEVEVLEVKPVESIQEEQLPSKPELQQLPSKPELPLGTVYLDWVWSLLDLGFSPDDVKQFAQSYEQLGFLPERSNEQIYSLAVAAQKAKSKGLTKSKLMLNMYKASVISGMNIGLEDLKSLISIAESKSKRAKRVA